MPILDHYWLNCSLGKFLVHSFKVTCYIRIIHFATINQGKKGSNTPVIARAVRSFSFNILLVRLYNAIKSLKVTVVIYYLSQNADGHEADHTHARVFKKA